MATRASRLGESASGIRGALDAIVRNPARAPVRLRDMGVRALEVELDRAGRLGGARDVLGFAVLEALRQRDARAMGSPVTGFRIGSADPSIRPGTRTRAVPAVSSIASSIALNAVGSPFVIVVLNTWVTSEPGSVSLPCAIASSAAR